MQVLGVTGGIGMGKSAAEEWLRMRGVPVIDTDLLARQVVEPGSPALSEIAQAFGSELLDDQGRLRRDALARLVFPNPAERQKLEQITHPRIRKLWRAQIQAWRAERHPVAAVVIPLLFETGAENEFDATVCVACSESTRRRRLLDRGMSPHEIDQRVAAQWLPERKIAKADFVVWNDGSRDVLGAQLERVVRSLTDKVRRES